MSSENDDLKTRQDMLRLEFFEMLYPSYLYTSRQPDGRYQAIDELMEGGRSFIYYLFNVIYKDDGVENPYKEEDFEVKFINHKGLFFQRIELPKINPDINCVKTVYFVYAMDNETGKVFDVAYLAVKYFVEDGKYYVVYISEDEEKYISNPLPDNWTDMEEIMKVGHIYALQLSQKFEDGKMDIELEEE